MKIFDKLFGLGACCNYGKRKEEQINDLKNKLYYGNTYEKWSSANTLAKMGKGAVDAIVALEYALIDKKNNSNVREECARALGSMGKEAVGSMHFLVDTFSDPSESLQVAAAFAVSKIGKEAPNEVVPQLIELLNEKNSPTIRQDAVIALEEIGPPAKQAVAALADILDSEKERESLKRFVVRALRSIREN